MLLPINKLQKIFKLESERNYDNRAVLGGIDKIIPSWESEARESHLAEDLIQQVATHLYRYPQADAQERLQEGGAGALRRDRLLAGGGGPVPITPELTPVLRRGQCRGAHGDEPGQRRRKRGHRHLVANAADRLPRAGGQLQPRRGDHRRWHGHGREQDRRDDGFTQHRATARSGADGDGHGVAAECGAAAGARAGQRRRTQIAGQIGRAHV